MNSQGTNGWVLIEDFASSAITSWPLLACIFIYTFKQPITRIFLSLARFISHLKQRDVTFKKGDELLQISNPSQHSSLQEFEDEKFNKIKQQLAATESEKDKISATALQLLEDLRRMQKAHFFESLLRGIVDWQLQILKYGLISKTCSREDLLKLINREGIYFTSPESIQSFNLTLSNLNQYGIINLNGDKISYTDLYYEFAKYMNWV